jgi:hypothetical protein
VHGRLPPAPLVLCLPLLLFLAPPVILDGADLQLAQNGGQPVLEGEPRGVPELS